MWFLVALAILIALAVALLCVPVEFHASAGTGARRFSGRLVWLFGLVKKEIRASGQKRKPREKKKQNTASPRVLFGYLRVQGLFRQVLQLVRGVLKRVHFRRTRIDLEVNAGDPAEAGMCFALLGPLTVLSGYSRFIDIKARPVESGDILKIEARGAVTARPVEFCPPLFRFVFSAPFARLAGKWLSGKWKR